MKKPLPLFPALLIAACLALMHSCAPEACFEETSSFLKATFYSNTSTEKAAPDSLTLYGMNMETNKIYNKAIKVQPAQFPLNASVGKCTFVIRINGVTDTIQFLYTSYPHLISKECGYAFSHTLDTFFYSKNTIDYIYRSSDNITTLNEENIRIFY